MTDSDDVREVVEAMLAAPSPPPVLVEMSTIAPAVARELAERVRRAAGSPTSTAR